MGIEKELARRYPGGYFSDKIHHDQRILYTQSIQVIRQT